jgi:hypothetical protein
MKRTPRVTVRCIECRKPCHVHPGDLYPRRGGQVVAYLCEGCFMNDPADFREQHAEAFEMRAFQQRDRQRLAFNHLRGALGKLPPKRRSG